MNRLFIFLAFRNLVRNKRRTAVTLMAVVIGVALLIILKGFTSSLNQLIVDGAIRGRVGALQIHKKGFLANVAANPLEFRFGDAQAMLEKVRQVPGVVGAAPRIQFSGLVSNGRNQTTFVGSAIDLEWEPTVCPNLTVQVVSGTSLQAGDQGMAVVGFELAESFGVAPGRAGADSLTLSSSSPTGRANSMDVVVKGLATSLLPFENKRFIRMPLHTAQRLLDMGTEVNEIALGVENLDHIDAVAEAVSKRLNADYGDTFEVNTWEQVQPFLRDIAFRQKVILSIIAVVLFIIALFGIANTMLMSVFERVREMGTMLAVGVTQQQIRWLFLLEGGFIGILGGASGALLGVCTVVIANAIGVEVPSPNGGATMDRLALAVSWYFVWGSAAVAIVCATLAAWFPAWKASRLAPVEALRSV